MSRGGPRPGAGRKPFAVPTTAVEAAVALSRIVGPGIGSTLDDKVVLDVEAAVAILTRLRKKAAPTR